MAIDNEIDAVHSQYDKQGTDVTDLLLAAAGEFGLPVGLITSLKEHFSGNAVRERVEALLPVLESTVTRRLFESLTQDDGPECWIAGSRAATRGRGPNPSQKFERH